MPQADMGRAFGAERCEREIDGIFSSPFKLPWCNSQSTVPEQRDNQGLSRKTKLRLLVAGVILLVAVGFGILFYGQREPSFAGKKLSEWVEEESRSDLKRETATRANLRQAIIHIGTNAIPYLIEYIKPPPPESPIREHIVDWLEHNMDVHIFHHPQPYHRASAAVLAFKTLGPLAKPAIPELEQLLLGRNEVTSSIARQSLVAIGPDSLSVLTNALQSKISSVRCQAVIAIGELGKQAGSASSMVEAAIHDPDKGVSVQAMLALGQLGDAGKQYIPELRQMLWTNHLGVPSALALAGLGCTRELLRNLTNAPALVRRNCTIAVKMRADDNGLDRWEYYSLMHSISEQDLQSDSVTIRSNAFQYLEKAMILVLTGYLAVKDADLRAQAADDLCFFGTRAYVAVPNLTIALSDESGPVRQSASNALKSIDVQFHEGGIVRGPRKAKRIALEFTGHTFAEGGETILNELSKHQAKASFFLTGDFLRNPLFKPLVERIVQEKHYLGPHSDKHLLFCSWDDPKKTLVSEDVFFADLSANLAEIHKVSPSAPRSKFWLPAYEHYNQQIVGWSKTLGIRPHAIPKWEEGLFLTLVNFTPGTRSNADYTQESDQNFVSSQAIFDSIVKKEREDPDGLNGFLLLLHLGAGPGRADKMHEKFGALLDHLSAKGYQFVRIDELLD